MSELNPSLKAWLRQFNVLLQEQQRKGIVVTPDMARDGLAQITRNLVTTAPEMAQVFDALIRSNDHDVPVRIYRRDPHIKAGVLVYLHGGGHMGGSVEVYDPICRKLAQATGYVVVSVDYRLAPEAPFPTGINDALTVIGSIQAYLRSRGIPISDELVLAGDSGGGAMTASIAHRWQQSDCPRIAKQVLIYPSLDYTMRHASLASNGRGYLLERERISWYFDHYLQHGENRREVSPLDMPLGPGMPATLVITAEFCPLRDEGIAYLQRLDQAGITTRHRHFDDMIHAFLNLEDLVPARCAACYAAIGEFLTTTSAVD